MKKYILLFVLSALAFTEASAYSKYWVQFTEKNNTPYSVSNPSAFLSARSIQRRQNQGIPVTWYDLPVDPSYVSQVLATGAVTLNYSSRWFNAISITTTDSNALTAIAALPFVVSTSPVQRHTHPDHFSEEADENPQFRLAGPGNPSAQSYNYGSAYNQVHQINADCLHDLGYHGEGMQIAVLDDGFNNVNTVPAFDSIRLNNQILGTYDFVAGVQNVYNVGGHGTMVLSCMAANLPGQIVGTAPEASYWLLRTEEAATEYVIEEDNWVAGAEFADSAGADIIATSLYYTEFDDVSQNHTYADMDGRSTIAAQAAVFTARVGMLTFACAGNSGSSAWFYVGTPADADSILAVGAVDASNNLAGFSSRGPSYDGRVKPDICAMGVNATVVNSSANVTTANGTSFATPLSAGAAACLWQSSPTKTAMEIRHAIQLSSSQFFSPDSLKGYGIPDFCQSNILLSAQSENAVNTFHVFPNPSAGAMTFSFAPLENEGVLELFDFTGKCVLRFSLQAGQSKMETDLSALPAGIYFSRLSANGKTVGDEKIVLAN